MGWRFELRHANIVAYLTVPECEEPPRVDALQLREFLGSFQGEYRDKPPLFSSDPRWVEAVVSVARGASDRAHALGVDMNRQTLVEQSVVKDILSDLRAILRDYELFGLTVGLCGDHEKLTAFAEHAAYSSKHHALFLIPDLEFDTAHVEFFDPLPVVRPIATRPDLWPGVLFWTPRGTATFAPLEAAYELYYSLYNALGGDGSTIDKILRQFNAKFSRQPGKRIVHLSDLHFGTQQALENQAYLSAHLSSKLEAEDRVVITGDLFDNPKKEDALAFRNFRSNLEVVSGRSAIVIPGNHDEKTRGNTVLGVGWDLRQVADLEWSSLVIDDELRCVFYCFDSSKDAPDFAKGRVTREQMIALATNFETKAARKSEIREYLSVALIHHHPYSFDASTETRIQRVLKIGGLREETFLRMDDADHFLQWCAGRQVPLILHGHKHIPRHVEDRIKWTSGKKDVWREITAVGCGTSLGAEDQPLSYNILEWSPSTRKWSVSFFADPGFGTGFEEQYVRLHTAEPQADAA